MSWFVQVYKDLKEVLAAIIIKQSLCLQDDQVL